MRTIASLVLGAICALALFFTGILLAFRVNIWIYGVEAFNHDVGAGFAVLLEGIPVGLILGFVGILLTPHIAQRIPWLRKITNFS